MLEKEKIGDILVYVYIHNDINHCNNNNLQLI